MCVRAHSIWDFLIINKNKYLKCCRAFIWLELLTEKILAKCSWPHDTGPIYSFVVVNPSD